MERYNFAEWLKEARRYLGWTQEELCSGICSVTNFQKVENGDRLLTMRYYTRLVEKIGKAGFPYAVFENIMDAEGFLLWEQIQESLNGGDYGELLHTVGAMLGKPDGSGITEDMLRRFVEEERKCGRFSAMMRQCMFLAIALLEREWYQCEPNLCLDYLLLAFQAGGEDNGGSVIGKPRLYSYEEILILYQIALQYEACGKQEASGELLLFLAYYMENHAYDAEQKSMLYGNILYGLAKRLKEAGEYDHALQICEKGVEFCSGYGCLHPLAELLSCKGDLLLLAGREAEATQCQRWAGSLHEVVKRFC